jgi:hypothetical protein
MIFEAAQCDGPSCEQVEPTPAQAEYPGLWIVLRVIQSPEDPAVHTAVGFCSRDCLVEWSRERPQ